MQPDPTKTKLQAIQYDYIDGTFEFAFGRLCLLLTGGLTLWSYMHHDPPSKEAADET